MESKINPIYLLSDQKIQDENIIQLPIFKIENLKFGIDFTTYDGLIFTSKNGVYSLNNNKQWINIPSYAIAPKTAKVLEQYGANIQYIGKSGHGDEFATELIPLLQNKKVLYIRAKKVVSNLVDILNRNSVICDELISYQTSCIDYLTTTQPPQHSIIIFSSPSTIECFLKNFTWDNSYIAVVIGKTTQKYLPKGANSYISQDRSIDSCIELAKNLSISN